MDIGRTQIVVVVMMVRRIGIIMGGIVVIVIMIMRVPMAVPRTPAASFARMIPMDWT